MRYRELIEGEIIDLARVKKDRTKASVGSLVDAFKALEAQWAAYKAEHGTFQPMMDDYEANQSDQNVPRFYVHVQFDHMATQAEKKHLEARGFEFSTDDPDWGTEIHDNETTRSFTHGAYMAPRQKNWYTQSEARKEVTKEQAVSLFANRNKNTFGIYRGKRPHYHKGNLKGSTKTGWDIRTHPEYAQHYLNGMAWWVEFRAPNYSEDAIVVDEAMMAEAVRVYDMISQVERIRKSGANVTRLFEGKWWDDEPTITLYHGTSSALLPTIREHGLHPPQEDLKAYAHDVLRHYLPEEQWTPKLLKMVDDHAVRAMAGRADDRGPVIFCKTHADGVEGYARAYAKDGGEIAMDVRRCVLLATKGGDELTWRELMKHQIPPRYPEGKPVVLQIEVPKSWCLFDHDLDQIKTRIAQANAEGKEWAQGDLGEVYDGVFEDREVRVTRPVPMSMILAITEIDED